MAPLACGCPSTMSLAVDSCKSTWIRDTKQLGAWGAASSFDYRSVNIFEYENMRLKL